jgi:hypothetical protein
MKNDCLLVLKRLALATGEVDTANLTPYSAERLVAEMARSLLEILGLQISEVLENTDGEPNNLIQEFASLRATLDAMTHRLHNFFLLPHVDVPIDRLTLIEKDLIRDLIYRMEEIIDLQDRLRGRSQHLFEEFKAYSEGNYALRNE